MRMSKSNNHCTRISVGDSSAFDSFANTSNDDHHHSESITSNCNCTTDLSSPGPSGNYFSTLQLKGRKKDINCNCKCKSTSTLPRKLNKNNLKASKLSMSSPLLPLSAPFQVVLKKKDGTLGFTICKKDDGMFYIKSVINEPAINEPAISPGDKILRVNGIDVSSLSHSSAISFLRSLPDIVTLKLEPVIPEDVSLDLEQLNFYSTSRFDRLLDAHESIKCADPPSDRLNGNTSTFNRPSLQSNHDKMMMHSNQSHPVNNNLERKDYTQRFIDSNVSYANSDVLDDESSLSTVKPDHLDSSGSSSSLSDIFYTEENLSSSKSQKNHSTSSLKKQLRPEALKMISEKGNTDSLSRLRLRKQKSKNRLQNGSNSSLPSSQGTGTDHSKLQSPSPPDDGFTHSSNLNNEASGIFHEKSSHNVVSPDDVMLILPPEQFSDKLNLGHSNHGTINRHQSPFSLETVDTVDSCVSGQSVHSLNHCTEPVQVIHNASHLAHSIGNHTKIPGHLYLSVDKGHRDEQQQLTRDHIDAAGNGMKISPQSEVDKCFNSSPAARSAKFSDAKSTCVKSGESTAPNEEPVKLPEITSVSTRERKSPVCARKKVPDSSTGASAHSSTSLDIPGDDANATSIDLLLSSTGPTRSAPDSSASSSKFALSPNVDSVTTCTSAPSSSNKLTAPSTVAAPTTCSSSSSSTSSSFAADDAIPSLAKWRGANLVDHLYLAAIRDEQDSGFGDSVTPRHTLDKPLQLSRLINERLNEEEEMKSDFVIPTITEETVDVCLEKGWCSRLGIQLEDDPLNRLPRLTVVKSIVPNTIASVHGTIKKGWRLESVNDIPLEDKPVKEVVEFLRRIKGKLNFRFLAPVDNH